MEAICYLYESDRFDEADTWAAEALQLLPDLTEIALAYARVARERGDTQEAVHRFRNVVSRFPNEPEAHAGFAGALICAGQSAVAEQVLRDAIAQFPDDAGLFAEYAEAAFIGTTGRRRGTGGVTHNGDFRTNSALLTGCSTRNSA